MKKKINEEFRVAGQLDRDIGIEIEMEGVGLNIKSTGWDLHTDGSLRGESIEYVLRRPVPEKDVDILLTRLQTDLKKNGAKLYPSDRCGVHIHINCQEMTIQQTINFCLLYLAVEEFLVRWCGEDREGNLFCLRAKDAEFIVNALCTAVQQQTFKNVSRLDIRYAALNITSLSKYGSLEFRALRTPKDFSIISTWIRMLMNVKKASLKYTSPVEIVEAISMMSATKFLSSIFGKDAKELYVEGMDRILMDSIRRVQDVAYAEHFIVKRKKKEGEFNYPSSYWTELISAIYYCRDMGWEFLHWNPVLQRMYYAGGRETSVRWVSAHSGEEIFGPAGQFNTDHQHRGLAFLQQQFDLAREQERAEGLLIIDDVADEEEEEEDVYIDEGPEDDF